MPAKGIDKAFYFGLGNSDYLRLHYHAKKLGLTMGDLLRECIRSFPAAPYNEDQAAEILINASRSLNEYRRTSGQLPGELLERKKALQDMFEPTKYATQMARMAYAGQAFSGTPDSETRQLEAPQPGTPSISSLHSNDIQKTLARTKEKAQALADKLVLSPNDEDNAILESFRARIKQYESDLAVALDREQKDANAEEI